MVGLAERDPEIASALRQEDDRQRNSLVLIASENYASRAVLEAQTSVMNNKYAEATPGDGTTVDASMSTSPSSWPWTALN